MSVWLPNTDLRMREVAWLGEALFWIFWDLMETDNWDSQLSSFFVQTLKIYPGTRFGIHKYQVLFLSYRILIQLSIENWKETSYIFIELLWKGLWKFAKNLNQVCFSWINMIIKLGTLCNLFSGFLSEKWKKFMDNFVQTLQSEWNRYWIQRL